jgi:hypothetical protein
VLAGTKSFHVTDGKQVEIHRNDTKDFGEGQFAVLVHEITDGKKENANDIKRGAYIKPVDKIQKQANEIDNGSEYDKKYNPLRTFSCFMLKGGIGAIV